MPLNVNNALYFEYDLKIGIIILTFICLDAFTRTNAGYFRIKNWIFPELGQSDQNFFDFILKSLILVRGTVENISKILFGQELQLFLYKKFVKIC